MFTTSISTCFPWFLIGIAKHLIIEKNLLTINHKPRGCWTIFEMESQKVSFLLKYYLTLSMFSRLHPSPCPQMVSDSISRSITQHLKLDFGNFEHLIPSSKYVVYICQGVPSHIKQSITNWGMFQKTINENSYNLPFNMDEGIYSSLHTMTNTI